MKYVVLIVSIFLLASCSTTPNPFAKGATWALKLCEGSNNFYRNCETVDSKIPSFDQCARDQRDFSRTLPRGERRSAVCLQD